MGEVIAVLSGKGGTGKTSLCAGIAEALAQMPKQVLCIDCDIGLRNLDIALGISELGALSFTEVSSGCYSTDAITSHPLWKNLRFLTAPMNLTADAIDRAEFSALLSRLRREYHYIFLDAPAGIEDGFRLAACSSDRVILVSGADPASVRDAQRSAQELEQLGKPARLVVNRLRKKMFKTVNLTVDDIMDTAGLPLLGVVPEDEDVVLAAAFGQPLLGYAEKGAAAACRRIARRIQGLRVKVRL